MTWLFALIALFLLNDARKMRARHNALCRLAPSEEAVSAEHRFITAEGVVLDDATRRAASAHARARGVRVLDLIPGDLPALRAWALLQVVDPEVYRRDRLGPGRTAGHAILVATDVLERAGAANASRPLAEVELTRLAGKLKRYAGVATDLAIAPGLRSIPEKRRRAVLFASSGEGASYVLAAVPLILGVIVCGAVAGGVGGLAALAAFQLQPLIALAGGPLHARGLSLSVLFRLLLEGAGWLGLMLEPRSPEDVARERALREDYGRLLSGGIERFFEPRQERCPLCASGDLEVHLRAPDMFQRKPGRFTLERCRACGHIFQNPRLSIEGLGFYYRDFYDGIGESRLDLMFGASTRSYLQRASAVVGKAAPSRWLDVGGGHGHFCCAAREVWPSTRFDALDLSESIEEARRRGWADTAYKGLFPELAPELAGAYDVVSMSHYLEHTRDPRAEIAAAETALQAGGLLLIEVPDPACALGRFLGRMWMPWFQPQHQHFLSVENLTKLLAERGFEPVLTHRGEAHQRVDFFLMVVMLVEILSPPGDSPWLPPPSAPRRALRGLVFMLGLPLLAVAALLDQLLGPFLERAVAASNTYRILAKKSAG